MCSISISREPVKYPMIAYIAQTRPTIGLYSLPLRAALGVCSLYDSAASIQAAMAIVLLLLSHWDLCASGSTVRN